MSGNQGPGTKRPPERSPGGGRDLDPGCPLVSGEPEAAAAESRGPQGEGDGRVWPGGNGGTGDGTERQLRNLRREQRYLTWSVAGLFALVLLQDFEFDRLWRAVRKLQQSQPVG
jgi:hypothetical protein